MKQKYREMIMTFLYGLEIQGHMSIREFQVLKNAIIKMKEVLK